MGALMSWKQLQFDFMNEKIQLYEIYSFEDQYHKEGFGGHIRFVAGENRNDATHKVAYDFPQWWRICGIREIPVEYWKRVHPLLASGSLEYRRSVEAITKFNSTRNKG
jgi:hypothetical protein